MTMMRSLHKIVLLDEKGMLEKLPVLYPEYEKAVEDVNAMVEDAELKIKVLLSMRQKHEIDREEFNDKKKDLKRCIDRADIMRYQCFERCISRYFDGGEDKLVSLMENNGYAVHSELYVQSGGSYINVKGLQFLDDLMK